MKYYIIPLLKKMRIYQLVITIYLSLNNLLLQIYPKSLNRIRILKNDLIFDVGANIGVKTEYYRKNGWRVICFEPQKLLVEKLKQKFEGDDDVIIEHCGIGSEKSELLLKKSSTSHSQATFDAERRREVDLIRKNNFTFDEEEIVKVDTLDYMIKKHGLPKYIKIDVETFEIEVISGLSQKVDYLSFEYNNLQLENTLKIIDKLEKLKFSQFTYGVGEGFPYPWSKWFGIQEFKKSLEQKAHFNKVGGGDIYCM
ncbi:MAG: FkbM family methyltransferase [Saprospiraceae bacterium]|nr:FkbM family methyltransferase [Saprospiraceae bacterium]